MNELSHKYHNLFNRADVLCNDTLLMKAGIDPELRKEIAKTLTELVAEVVHLRKLINRDEVYF